MRRAARSERALTATKSESKMNSGLDAVTSGLLYGRWLGSRPAGFLPLMRRSRCRFRPLAV